MLVGNSQNTISKLLAILNEAREFSKEWGRAPSEFLLS